LVLPSPRKIKQKRKKKKNKEKNKDITVGLFQFLLGRIIGRLIGLNVRYLFFKLIRKKVSYDSLTTPVINKDNDYDEKGLQQDMYNALVGAATILIAIFILKFLLEF
jgi:hypothetical protein